MLTKVLEPSTVVKLGIVSLNKTIIIDLHIVDAMDRVGSSLGERSDAVSPGDTLAVVPDVESLNVNLRLENSLAIVEGRLVCKCDGAELNQLSVPSSIA